MRRRPLALTTLLLGPLLLAGCTSTIEGSASPAEAPSSSDGPLAQLREDVDLGISASSGGRLVGARVDADGTPVAVTLTEDYQVQVVRGTGPGEPTTIAAFGDTGQVEGMTLTEDGTLVTVGYAGEDSDPSVVRISPDDTASVLTMTGPGAEDDGIFYALDTVAFSADGATAVLARTIEEHTPATTISTGEVEVRTVDTTTGQVSAPVRVRVTDPAARGSNAPRFAIQDIDRTPDGGAVLAVDVPDAGGTVTAQLVRFGADLSGGDLVTVQEGLSGDDPRYIAVDDTGRVYSTASSEERVTLLAVDPGSTEVVEVGRIDQSNYVGGLAVDPAGGWAYLTGMVDLDRGEKVTIVSLESGEVVVETAVCDSGFLDAPVLGPTGSTLVVSGDCLDDDPDGATHLYVLTA
jgi:hypothetical protein